MLPHRARPAAPAAGLLVASLFAPAALAQDPTEGTEETAPVVRQDEDDEIVIKVTDNGGGVPEDIRDKIFDPFCTTKGVGKGTGQGLAISRDVIVQKHGGSIECQVDPGEGTTFVIRFPLDEEEVLAEAA